MIRSSVARRTVADALIRLGCCSLAAGMLAHRVLAADSGAPAETARPQANVVIRDAGAEAAALAPGTAAPEAPDERVLWRLFESRDDTLPARLTRLRAAYPDWRPSKALTEAMARREDEAELQAAEKRRDWPALQTIAARRPDFALCARPYDAAMIAAAAQAENGTGASHAALDSSMADCRNDPQRLALLIAATDQLGAGATRPFIESHGRDDRTMVWSDDADRSAWDALQYRVARQALLDDLRSGTGDMPGRARDLAPRIAAQRDAGTATALGWAALHDRRPADAIAWFRMARDIDPSLSPEGLARAELAAGDTRAAEQAIAGHPDLSGLRRDVADRAVIDAYRRGRYAEAIAAAAPGEQAALVAWSRFQLGQYDQAARDFERLYRAAPSADAANGLLLSLARTGHFAEAAALADQWGGPLADAFRVSQTAPAGRKGTDTGYDFHVAWLANAVRREAASSGDADPAGLQLGDLGPAAVARRDGAAMSLLGWDALHRGDLDAAGRWFAQAEQAAPRSSAAEGDAQYGQALVAYRLARYDAVVQTAGPRAASSDRWRGLWLDGLMGQARQAERHGDSERGEQIVSQVLAADPGRRDARLMQASFELDRGHAKESAQSFEQLYRAEPDNSAAVGLGAALADDPANLSRLADAMGGPLVTVAAHQKAAMAFSRQQFLTAAQDPDFDSGLATVGSPWVGGDAAGRGKTGTPGTSALSAVTGDVGGAVTSGTDVFQANLHLISLSSGSPAAGTAIGSAGPPIVSPTTSLGLGVEPKLAWRREAGASPFAELGLTPIGGRVAPTVEGRAGATLWLRQGYLTGEIYRQSVTESILSYTGIVDPATGRSFGRVTESGGKAQGYMPLAGSWGGYGLVSTGARTGQSVDTNAHVGAAASVFYDLRLPGFAYATLGPSYQFDHFAQNLSGFTVGQGGYYSPSWFHKAGLGMQMLSAEGRDVIASASVFPGWQWAQQASDCAASFGGGACPGGRQDGFNVTGQVIASYLLSEHWRIGGLLRFQQSPQYRDIYGGFALAFSFQPRTALYSSDLPRFDLR